MGLRNQKQKIFPVIRFLGFEGSWEQRKLSSIVDRITRKNTDLESTLPLTISTQDGLVDQVTYFNNRVASQNISNYYLVKNGEFAYNKSSSDGYPFGTVKRLDLYDMGVLSTLYIVFALKDQNVNSDFLACYYDTDNWYKQVSERAAEGARNHGLLNISAEDFLDTDLMIPPDIQEQALIGDYLKKLDNLIALHQNTFETLTKIKTVMLETMFPQRGSLVPELRFTGFTNTWEQRKLSELTDSIDTGKSKFEVKEDGDYEILGSTSVIGYDDSYDYEGGFILTARVGANAGNLYRHSGKVKISDNTVFIQGDNLEFIYYLLDSFDIKRLSFGTGQPLVKASELKSLDLRVPQSETERREIGQFLKSIDEIITLHRRKYEKLKQIKQAMLQKMFEPTP